MDEKLSENPQAAEERYRQLRDRMAAGEDGAADFYVRLGYAALEMGYREEGIICLKKALKRDPTQAFLFAKLKSLCPPGELTGIVVEPAAGSYRRMILSALRYPIRGSGIAMIILGSVIFFILRVIAIYTIIPFIGTFIMMFVAGYIMTYLFSVMKTTGVLGRDDPPDWPDVLNPYDVAADLSKSLAAHLAAFLPLIAFSVYTAIDSGRSFSVTDTAADSPIHGALALFGLCYYPMALLVAGMYESILACFNPIFVIRSIVAVSKDYLLTILFLLGVGGIFVAFEYLLLVELQLPYLAVGFFILIAELTLGMATMRAVGLLYRCNRSRLGWFQ